MKSTIDTIIEELFSLDPSLREQEKEVRAILSRMMEAKPDVHVDEQFVKELRTSLLHQPLPQKSATGWRQALSIFERHTLFTGVVVAASLLLAVGVATYQSRDAGVPTPLALLNNKSAMRALEGNAFGSLNYLAGVAGGNVQLGAPETRSAMPGAGLGGGGGVAQDAAKSMASPLIYPYPSYAYTYTGDSLTVPGDAMPVYRRVKQMPGAGGVIGSIQSIANRMLNMASFGSLNLYNMTFVQDAPDGYLVTLDFFEGRASVQPNFQKWYMAAACTPQGCPAPTPIQESDVPADDTLISLANAFLSSHGVDRSKYGTPVVDNQWKEMQKQPLGGPEERMMIAPYVPDVISVVYPIVIDGQTIQEYSALPYGLRVNVDIRKQKVQGLWNLTSETYDKSSYAIETDVQRIIKIAERGGSYGYAQGGETVTLSLGTPTLVYIQHYLSKNPYDPAQELYIPALQFPITNPPQDQPYFQKFITVPLVKDVLDMYDQAPMPVDAPIRIMEDAAEKK